MRKVIEVCLYWYFEFILFIPRLLLRWNYNWNPVVIVGRNVLQRALSDTGFTKENKPNPLRWLHSDEKKGQHIALASYPRSGNSLLRHLLENLTGVYTGCDTDPKRTLSQQLQQFGMHGEGVVDDSVWFVKTHFPERHGWKPFKAHKAILVVRNPWDAIDSYFNMTLTNSHRTSIADNQYERFADRWDTFLRNEIHVWVKFYRYWTRKQPIPIMVVRYEDLLVHRRETLRRILLFLTDSKTLEGTAYQQQLDQLQDTQGPYKPRSGKIAASFKHYSPQQFAYIVETARMQLKGFGYDPESQGFPDAIPLPRRQVKPASQPCDELHEACVVVNGVSYHLRQPGDSCGRLATQYRKSLTEAVIAKDGTELNLEEVRRARERKLNM